MAIVGLSLTLSGSEERQQYQPTGYRSIMVRAQSGTISDTNLMVTVHIWKDPKK